MLPAIADVIEESAAVKIAAALRADGASLSVYDPAGMKNTREVLGENAVRYAESAKECIQGADICILTTPWKEFKGLKPGDFTAAMKKPVLIDCWKIYDRKAFSREMDYTTIGYYRSGEA